MEYLGLGVIFGILSLPFIIYFIHHLDVMGDRHREIVKKWGREKRQASADAFHSLPYCHCQKCGHAWRSRKRDLLPLTCPNCGRKDWWWREPEYHHYSFLTTRK